MIQRWNEWRDRSPIMLSFIGATIYFGVYLFTINLIFTPGPVTGRKLLLSSGGGVLFGLFTCFGEWRRKRRGDEALRLAVNRSIRTGQLSVTADPESLLAVLKLRLTFYKRGVWVSLGLFGVMSLLCIVMLFTRADPVLWACLLAFFVIFGSASAWQPLSRARSTRDLLDGSTERVR